MRRNRGGGGPIMWESQLGSRLRRPGKKNFEILKTKGSRRLAKELSPKNEIRGEEQGKLGGKGKIQGRPAPAAPEGRGVGSATDSTLGQS